jgi:hypothetical protein
MEVAEEPDFHQVIHNQVGMAVQVVEDLVEDLLMVLLVEPIKYQGLEMLAEPVGD